MVLLRWWCEKKRAGIIRICTIFITFVRYTIQYSTLNKRSFQYNPVTFTYKPTNVYTNRLPSARPFFTTGSTDSYLTSTNTKILTILLITNTPCHDWYELIAKDLVLIFFSPGIKAVIFIILYFKCWIYKSEHTYLKWR